MSENRSGPWYEKLPELGDDADFAAMRTLMADSGYTNPGIRERLRIDSIANYCAPPEGGRQIRDAFDALVALFFDCAYVEEEKLKAALPEGAVGVLDRLGMLVRNPAPPGMLFASAAILPPYGVLILCDRGQGPDGSRAPYPPDVVYPPVFDTTERFIAAIPFTPCEAMLDLGTGTGMAALLGARNAGHVWATDITPRSIRFTEFNRRLAGIENMSVVMGDLYEPVAGLTFDRIVIHPPYVPSKIRRSDHVFAVSGEDGEQIIRRTVEGLPTYLRPGGRFYSLQIATDREGEDFEERVRKWLGAANENFDIVTAVHSRRTPAEYLAHDETRLVQERENWVDLWERTHTRYMVYATLLIERHDEPRRPLTRRAYKGAGYTGRHLDWLLEWQKALAREDHVEMLLECRPVGRPENELLVVHRLREGGFRREEFRLEIPGPFVLSLRCEDWLAQLIPDCDGKRTWRELFEHARQNQIIRQDVPIEEFARGLGVLVALGALNLAT
ncbi:MAG TPA: class I SAM-dependent methyltransferase [Bryobacteraceae bacterium]|nr:class I SAM-dependent methyltransferase [Bryobacteraceae bacterium]